MMGSTPTYFYGATDLQLFLARLVPTCAEVQRVWLAGTSAAGYGSCRTCSSPSSLYTYERSADPESRFAFLSFQYDSTIAPDLGLTLPQFQQDLDALIAGFDANEKAFIVRNAMSAPAHVVMNNI